MRRHFLINFTGSAIVAAILLSGCGGGGTTSSDNSSSLKQPFDTRKVSRAVATETDWTWYVGVDACYDSNDFSMTSTFYQGIPAEVQHLQFFIDVDNNSATGFSYGKDSWRISGADYLIEDGSLYKSTNNSKWSWEYIAEMSYNRATKDKNPFAFTSTSDRKLMKIFDSKHINVTIEPFDINWGSTYSTISTESIKVERSDTGFENARALIPEDSNIAFEPREDIMYLTDVRTEDGGLNRAISIDTKNLSYEAVTLKGSNPHSIDRAGKSNKFYLRTQSSNSISVVNFETGSEKVVKLGNYFPRTAGATNLKHNIQLISMHNAPVISIIDINTDTIIATVGDSSASAPNMANGHPLWFDEDHFGLIDRVNKNIRVYKVEKGDSSLNFIETDSVAFETPVHITHKTAKVSSLEELNTFYAMGEGDIDKSLTPFVAKMHFDSKNGTLTILQKTELPNSDKIIKGIKPIAHHGGTTPDGKYFFATILDGKTYILDIDSMEVVKVLESGLGSGHVSFSKEENVAIITNHSSDYVTIIDLTTLKIKAKIVISKTKFDEEHPALLQLHNPIVSHDGRYFLTAASHDGDFVKIDLRTLKVDSKLHIGGILDQTSS